MHNIPIILYLTFNIEISIPNIQCSLFCFSFWDWIWRWT